MCRLGSNDRGFIIATDFNTVQEQNHCYSSREVQVDTGTACTLLTFCVWRRIAPVQKNLISRSQSVRSFRAADGTGETLEATNREVAASRKRMATSYQHPPVLRTDADLRLHQQGPSLNRLSSTADSHPCAHSPPELSYRLSPRAHSSFCLLPRLQPASR